MFLYQVLYVFVVALSIYLICFVELFWQQRTIKILLSDERIISFKATFPVSLRGIQVKAIADNNQEIISFFFRVGLKFERRVAYIRIDSLNRVLLEVHTMGLGTLDHHSYRISYFSATQDFVFARVNNS